MIPETYKCPNCGAPIGYVKRCQYCGSVIEWIPTTGIKFIGLREDTVQLNAEVELDQYLVRTGVVTKEMVIDTLKEELAKQIIPFMTVYENFDIREMKNKFHAVLVVVRNRHRKE